MRTTDRNMTSLVNWFIICRPLWSVRRDGQCCVWEVQWGQWTKKLDKDYSSHTRAHTSVCIYTHRYVVTVWAVGLLMASARGGWGYWLTPPTLVAENNKWQRQLSDAGNWCCLLIWNPHYSKDKELHFWRECKKDLLRWLTVWATYLIQRGWKGCSCGV